MRLTAFLLLAASLHVSAGGFSQKVTLSGKKVPLANLFNIIRDQTGYEFVFDARLLKNRVVDIDVKEIELSRALDQCLYGQALQYTIYNKTIVVTPANETATGNHNLQPPVEVKGKVSGVNGLPAEAASVLLKQNKVSVKGTATDSKGEFTLAGILPGKYILEVTMLGFEVYARSLVITDQAPAFLNIGLTEAVKNLDETVVNGYFARNKSSFTGNARVISGNDLVNMGTQNIFKSLTLIDPSINIIENNNSGSDPNALPKIRFRGESQFQGFESIDKSGLLGDPNLPTFILDGFQTTLQIVLDLDMYRIESVTILKDAAATAIYGSRASNGVIVIKTKQPKEGVLQVNYNIDADFNFPDLSAYNLLNAAENIALYDKFGMYRKDDGTYEPQYNKIATWIAEGVNTDWMSQPVRNAVGQKHSLNLSGGDKSMRYGFNLRYSNNPGVMKESYRKNLGVSMNLQYSLREKFLFSNSLTVDKNSQQQSPYGNFEDYTLINSFFPIYDKTGKLYKYYKFSDDPADGVNVQWGTSGNIPYNPLYEAAVGNRNQSNYLNINNNFAMDWSILSSLKLRAQFSYAYNINKNTAFLSPNSATYPDYEGNLATTPIEDRGKYTYRDTKGESFNGNMVLSYSREFNGHFVNASGGFNLAQNTSTLYGFAAQGFGSGDIPEPSFAQAYEKAGVPLSSQGMTRLYGWLSSVNYTYRNRFLADISYRLDGSSQFGSKEKTAPFYSLGVGWNIHNERFFQNQIVNKLKIRGTLGETGSVSFAPYQAKDIYEYYKDSRYDGNLAAHLMGLGNENLRWQNTLNREVGVEAGLWNRIDITVAYYSNKTKNMVLPVTIPPSVGFESFTDNLGQMNNKGFEINLRGFLVKRKDYSISMYANGVHNANKILSISSALESYNKSIDNRANYASDNAYKQASHTFLTRYQEGGSATAIYAVRSLGIDPITGQEFFLTKAGVPTLDWKASDKVEVGQTDPKLRGSFGVNAGWKGIFINVTWAYQFGGQVYNQTLVDKVENSNKYLNVDKRVLNETWHQPGDVVSFKANQTGRYALQYTYASSRFVQNYNYLSMGSASVQYELPARIVGKAGLKSARVSLTTADLMYLSTVQRERGTDYPYSRTFSLSLRTNL